MISGDEPLSKGYEPTPSDRSFARCMHAMMSSLLNGEIESIAIIAQMKDGGPACHYLDPDLEGDSLLKPLEAMRSMYELNQSFRQQTTAPPDNRSYRSH